MQLLWTDVAGERDYHAAFINSAPATNYHSQFHSHDFHEVMLVLAGSGMHAVNGFEMPLQARDMVLVRPQDYHAIVTRGNQGLQFINIAWRSSLWREFTAFAGFSETAKRWEDATSSVAIRVPRESFAACRGGFDQILSAFHWSNSSNTHNASQTSRLELASFWAMVISHLAGIDHTAEISQDEIATEGQAVRSQSWPNWLREACHAMRGDNLQLGLPCFIELAGVTPEHLGRTLRAYSGQTPTEWINARRLQQAALLLTTTPNSVSDIAFDCGFSNVSYFHRLFRQRYGESPRSYRLQAGRMVAP